MAGAENTTQIQTQFLIPDKNIEGGFTKDNTECKLGYKNSKN